MNESVSGGLARRAIAWIIMIAVAVIALKIVIGIVAGLVATVFSLALLALLVVGVIWALRHI
jgi:hypothetical protein